MSVRLEDPPQLSTRGNHLDNYHYFNYQYHHDKNYLDYYDYAPQLSTCGNHLDDSGYEPN